MKVQSLLMMRRYTSVPLENELEFLEMNENVVKNVEGKLSFPPEYYAYMLKH